MPQGLSSNPMNQYAMQKQTKSIMQVDHRHPSRVKDQKLRPLPANSLRRRTVQHLTRLRPTPYPITQVASFSTLYQSVVVSCLVKKPQRHGRDQGQERKKKKSRRALRLQCGNVSCGHDVVLSYPKEKTDGRNAVVVGGGLLHVLIRLLPKRCRLKGPLNFVGESRGWTTRLRTGR